MERPLAERSFVVTGGAGALGRAVVHRLIDAGAICHVTWQTEGDLDAFDLNAHHRIRMHHVDCTNEEQVRTMYAEVEDLWGSIHVAGGFAMGAIEETSLEAFRRMYETNAVTCFVCCREAVRQMAGPGRIVNVSAKPVLRPGGNLAAYAPAKAAVASLTQTLAEELRDRGILVNAVLPSLMDTPANRGAMPDADHDAWPKPHEVAEAIAFLAGPENTLTSGALVPVYGRV